MGPRLKRPQNLFIYGSKEMVVLILLLGMIGIFTFTLGIHLGKRVNLKTGAFAIKDLSIIGSVPDQIPNRQEFAEQAKSTQQILEETLKEELHEEVAKAAIHIEV